MPSRRAVYTNGHRTARKHGRGRKPYFTSGELKILRRIAEDRQRLGKRVTRSILAKKFYSKTGRKIENLQRISDYRGIIGVSLQKERRRSSRSVSIYKDVQINTFLTKERRKKGGRKAKWFVDQSKLVDDDVGGRSYGLVGNGGAYVASSEEDGPTSGSGTLIASCNWDEGMGYYEYVRNQPGPGGGTSRDHMMSYFRRLRDRMPKGSYLYLDNAKVNMDKKFRSVEALFAKKEIEVIYLPSYSTHRCSPLDQTPFAEVKRLWKLERHAGEDEARRTIRRILQNISVRVVRDGIKRAGF